MKESLLDVLLDPNNLSVRFQPIFRIHERLHQVHALEALVRGPKGTNFERADILFDYVRRKHAEAAMDRTCFEIICKTAKDLPTQFRINVNVHAVTLGQKAGFTDFFWKLAERCSIPMERFTIEIVEHAPSCNIPALMDTVTALRDSGARIALDDIGLGQSNYRMMLDCQPEYFKLDAYFVRSLKNYPRRRAVVESVVTLAAAMQGSVVAEGVESADDLLELHRMNVEYVQANLLCAAMTLDDLRATGLLGQYRSEHTFTYQPAQRLADLGQSPGKLLVSA